MTAIIISGSSKSKVKSYASNLARAGDPEYNTSILGPVEAPLFLIRGKYRYRLLLKGNNRKILNKFTKNIMKTLPPPPSIQLIIDVDPYSFV